MEERSQPLASLGVERRVDGVRSRGAGLQCGHPRVIKGADGITHRLLAAAHAAGDGWHVLATGTGQHDLAAAQGKGVRRAQTRR